MQSLSLQADAPLPVAGKVVLETDAHGATVFRLLDSRDLKPVAVLTGDNLETRIDEWVILQTDFAGQTYLGLPILKVIEILPEHWEHAFTLDQLPNGFGAYSGFVDGSGFANYTRTPYEDRRAYLHDTGENLRTLRASIAAAFPLQPLSLTIFRAGPEVILTWEAQAGLRYDLLSSLTADAAFLYTTDVTADAPRSISLRLPAALNHQFFQLRY